MFLDRSLRKFTISEYVTVLVVKIRTRYHLRDNILFENYQQEYFQFKYFPNLTNNCIILLGMWSGMKLLVEYHKPGFEENTKDKKSLNKVKIKN